MITSIGNIINVLPLLMKALFTTLELWFLSGCISFGGGFIWGILASKYFYVPVISRFCDITTFILRGIPFFVQLLLAYFVIPDLLGINVPTFLSAIISLGLNAAAYMSEIVRGGINSIAWGQWQAALVLGYTKIQTLRFIILPQVFRNILPAIYGELDGLLKATSIVSSLGIFELTKVAQCIIAIYMQPVPVYLLIASIYLGISTLLSAGARRLERKYHD